MRIAPKIYEADGGVLRPFRRTGAENVCDCEIQGAGAEDQGEQGEEGEEEGQEHHAHPLSTMSADGTGLPSL